MKEQLLRIRGLSINKKDFEEKYGIALSDLEWKILSQSVSVSWEDHLDELRLLAFKHIRKSMEDLGFKVELNGSDIGFRKQEQKN